MSRTTVSFLMILALSSVTPMIAMADEESGGVEAAICCAAGCGGCLAGVAAIGAAPGLVVAGLGGVGAVVGGIVWATAANSVSKPRGSMEPTCSKPITCETKTCKEDWDLCGEDYCYPTGELGRNQCETYQEDKTDNPQRTAGIVITATGIAVTVGGLAVAILGGAATAGGVCALGACSAYTIPDILISLFNSCTRG